MLFFGFTKIYVTLFDKNRTFPYLSQQNRAFLEWMCTIPPPLPRIFLAIPRHSPWPSRSILLATLLHRSWDDCHFGPLKPLIINLTFPDFWQRRSRTYPLWVKNSVADRPFSCISHFWYAFAVKNYSFNSCSKKALAIINGPLIVICTERSLFEGRSKKSRSFLWKKCAKGEGIHFFCTFLSKNLVNSKKSSIFAAAKVITLRGLSMTHVFCWLCTW